MESIVPALIVILVIIILYMILIIDCRKKTSEDFTDFRKKMNRLEASVNPPWIMNSELNPVIYKLARVIVHKINKKLNTTYIIGTFDNVIEDYDNDGNKRLIMDFFVYQMNHQNVNDLNRKIIVDLTLFKGTNNVQVNTINFSNAYKLEEPTQLEPSLSNDLLIIEPTLTGKDQTPMRFSFKEALEFDKFNEPLPINLKDINRRNWILPVAIQDKKYSETRAFPCTDYGDWWDENAIPLSYEQENGLPTKPKPKWCYNSYNSATQPQLIVPQKRPQYLKQPSDRTYNDWLFDRRVGITGFPHGSS
jgi:hypothetical protein